MRTKTLEKRINNLNEHLAKIGSSFQMVDERTMTSVNRNLSFRRQFESIVDAEDFVYSLGITK